MLKTKVKKINKSSLKLMRPKIRKTPGLIKRTLKPKKTKPDKK